MLPLVVDVLDVVQLAQFRAREHVIEELYGLAIGDALPLALVHLDVCEDLE